MLKIDDSRKEGYVGLLPAVRYRVELGFAFVDDGDRLFKIQLGLFERAIGARAVEPDALAQVTELIRKHETVFALFDTEEEASSSLLEKEV